MLQSVSWESRRKRSSRRDVEVEREAAVRHGELDVSDDVGDRGHLPSHWDSRRGSPLAGRRCEVDDWRCSRRCQICGPALDDLPRIIIRNLTAGCHCLCQRVHVDLHTGSRPHPAARVKIGGKETVCLTVQSMKISGSSRVVSLSLRCGGTEGAIGRRRSIGRSGRGESEHLRITAHCAVSFAASGRTRVRCVRGTGRRLCRRCGRWLGWGEEVHYLRGTLWMPPDGRWRPDT